MNYIVCSYPETLDEFNFNNKLKTFKQKKWKSSIDYNFINKIDIYNLAYMTKYIKSKCDLEGFVKLSFEKITIPQNLVNLIKSNIGSANIDLDFIPSKFALNLQNINIDNDIDNNNNDNFFSHIINKINKNLGFDLDEKLLLLKKIVYEDLLTFFPNSVEGKNLLFHQQNTKDFKPIIINSKDCNDCLLIYEFAIIMLKDNYILIIPNNVEVGVGVGVGDCYTLMTNGKTYIKSNNSLIVDVIKKELVLNDYVYRNYGYIKNNNTQKEIFNYSIDSNLVINEYHDYSNNETKLKLKLFSKKCMKKNIYVSKYIKNGCEFEVYYNGETNFKHIISQCMINDNDTGLRYRGKYSGTSEDGKNISKTITIDDKIVYNKKGDETITNLLVDKKKYLNRTEIIIGWKVGKSIENELRIIKLGIIPDAQIIRPIDEEYFISHNKERCDKAIVMDIQLPIENEEISVVPNELEAYSYIYKSTNTNFKYKIGQEVLPDSFNFDENISCAQGIHFFQNRIDVFKAYVY